MNNAPGGADWDDVYMEAESNGEGEARAMVSYAYKAGYAVASGPPREPVAWRWRAKGSSGWRFDDGAKWRPTDKDEGLEWEPLYAAPPATPDKVSGEAWKTAFEQEQLKFQQETRYTSMLTRSIAALLKAIYDSGGEIGPNHPAVLAANRAINEPVNCASPPAPAQRPFPCNAPAQDDCTWPRCKCAAPAAGSPAAGERKCQCTQSDAWRCAVDRSLKTISCHCTCHRTNWKELPNLERGEQAIELTSGPLQPTPDDGRSDAEPSPAVPFVPNMAWCLFLGAHCARNCQGRCKAYDQSAARRDAKTGSGNDR